MSKPRGSVKTNDTKDNLNGPRSKDRNMTKSGISGGNTIKT